MKRKACYFKLRNKNLIIDLKRVLLLALWCIFDREAGTGIIAQIFEFVRTIRTDKTDLLFQTGQALITDIQQEYLIGQEAFFHSFSTQYNFGVVFEDDTETGYFYAIDKSENPEVLDGLHIYNVADITEKKLPTHIQIAWREDGLLASLLINNHCHAIFDFANRAGYCRNGFPVKVSDWTLIEKRELTEEMIKEIFTKGN